MHSFNCNFKLKKKILTNEDKNFVKCEEISNNAVLSDSIP